MNKRAIIFCSGEMDTDDVWKEEYNDDLIICADGGIKHTKRLGISPDRLIGDFDSAEKECQKDTNCLVYPPEKDYTDTNLCIDYAIEKGCDEILIFGGLGGRVDHEFSHFALMLYGLNKGVKIKLLNGRNEIWMENQPFVLEKTEKKYVSFFPYGGNVEDFSVKGLKYEADNIVLDCGLVQASSNEFMENDQAEISFKKGNLLVMLCQDLL